jgi:hypothetical protein
MEGGHIHNDPHQGRPSHPTHAERGTALQARWDLENALLHALLADLVLDLDHEQELIA